MALIPLNQKITTISASVNTVEKRSSVLNSNSETYTMADVVETVNNGISQSYTSIVFGLSQSGTNEPTYVGGSVLSNDTGKTISITRGGVGAYTVAFNEPVTGTVVFYPLSVPFSGRAIAVDLGNNNFFIATQTLAGDYADSILSKTWFEIRIYE